MSDENENSNRNDEAPGHLFLIEARAKGYQLYVERLKRGGKSGISEMFGSAEEVFAERIETQPVDTLDVSQLAPPSSDEFEDRAIAYAQSVRKVSGDFLREHLWGCQDGKLGADVQKQATKYADDGFSAVVKDMCCLMMYITTLEQGVFESKFQWYQQMFALSFKVIDQVLDGPSTAEIMRQYDYFEVSTVCQKGASRIGDRFGFGLVGTSAWSAVQKYLVTSGATRRELLRAALEDPLEV